MVVVVGEWIKDSWTVSRESWEPLRPFSTSVSSPIKGGDRTVPEAPSKWHSYIRQASGGSRKDLCRLPAQPPASLEVLGQSL